MSYNYGLRLGATQKLTTNNASAPSSAFGVGTEYIRIVGDANFHFVIDGTPTASATSAFMTGDEVEIVKVSPGQKIAVFHGSATNVYVSEMSG